MNFTIWRKLWLIFPLRNSNVGISKNYGITIIWKSSLSSQSFWFKLEAAISVFPNLFQALFALLWIHEAMLEIVVVLLPGKEEFWNVPGFL